MSVRKSLAWALSGQASSFLLTLTGSILLARLLSPREMGIYAVANATVGVLSIIGAAGISAFVIRETEMPARRLASAFTLNTMLCLLIATLIFGSSAWAAHFMKEPGVERILRHVAIIPLISIFDFRPSAMMQRDMRFRQTAIIATTAALLTSGTQVGLAFAGFSYMSMAYASITGAAFVALADNIVGRRYVGFALSLSDWRRISAFGLRMLTISGVANLAQRASEIILGRLLGVSALGLYSRASNIANLIFFQVYGTATRFTFTKLSKDHRETGSVTDTFLISLEMIISFMWPMMIGMAILSGPVIEILYGPKWIGAAPVLSLLMIAQFFILAFGMNWELFVIHDEIKRQTRFELIRAAFGTAAFAIGCAFSIAAAALGRIVEALFGLVLYLPHMSRLSGASVNRIAGVYARSLALTAAATFPALVLMMSSGWSPHVNRVLLAGSIALGVGAWLATLFLIDHALTREIRKILALLMPNRFDRATATAAAAAASAAAAEPPVRPA